MSDESSHTAIAAAAADIERGGAPVPAAVVVPAPLIVDADADLKAPAGHDALMPLSPSRRRTGTPITLSFENVGSTVEVREGKNKRELQILHGVSGVVRPGHLMAVMGPSGAGKSTLLDILALRRPHTEGTILVNGQTVTPATLKKIAGYVTQADNLMPTLTVRETLEFYANLKLPRTFTIDQRKERVDSVVKKMGLTDCQNTFIGSHMIRGISGGERRRVSIAIELLTEPALLFLDEPTSGLDSSTSVKIMRSLNDLASMGHTIVCTIHQPRASIFAMFDELLLLARGKTVYQGHAADALAYFAQLGFRPVGDDNPADFMLDMLTFYDEEDPAAKCAEVQEHYAKSDTAQRIQEELTKIERVETPELHRNSEAAGFFRQLFLLYGRANLNIVRSPVILRARIFQAVTMSLLIGLIFLQLDYSQQALQSRAGVIIMLVLGNVMPVVGSIVNVFPDEKAVFLREQSANCYGVLPYFIARSTVDIPHQVITTGLFAVISYWMVGLHHTAAKFFIFAAILFITNITAMSLGIAISAGITNAAVGNVLAPMIAIVFVLFSGFFANLQTIPVWLRWISYISFVRYALQALDLNEFTGAVFTCTEEQVAAGKCSFRTGEAYLELLGFDNVNIWQCALIILALTVGFRVIGYVMLKMQTRNRTA